jgi:hypothetical protein
MIMALPFGLGLLGIVFSLAEYRRAVFWTWSSLIVVLLAWLRFHATDVLPISL